MAAPPPPPAPARRQGRSAGSRNFCKKETMGENEFGNMLNSSCADFLVVVHRIKPAGSIAWERVAAEYESSRRDIYPPRTAEQLKRRWKTLIKNNKPTGNRDCPSDVPQKATKGYPGQTGFHSDS